MRKHIPKFDIALSYARKDEQFVKMIFEKLQEEYNVFYDLSQYKLLVCKYLHEILYDVFFHNSKYFIMIISEDYFISPHTMWEARNIIASSIEYKTSFLVIADDKIDKHSICSQLFIPDNDYLFYSRKRAEDNMDELISLIKNRV